MKPWLLGRHPANPYFGFTDACNASQPVVILASGQACVGIAPTPDRLAVAIDAETRANRKADDQRIQAYSTALQPWTARFRSLGLDEIPLEHAHRRCCDAAADCLPATSPWP